MLNINFGVGSHLVKALAPPKKCEIYIPILFKIVLERCTILSELEEKVRV
jgi:hypothetical protein